MKRNLSMLLAGLMVLVMASPLYAAPDIKVNGQIRNRFRYWVDLDLNSDTKIGKTDTGAADRRYFDNRTRLGVDAKLSDGVRAVIQLEKYFDWGNTAPNSAQAPFAGATPGNSAQDPYIRQAFVDFAIPGLQEEGTRFQIGRSFFRLGHGYLWGNSLTGEDGATIYGPLGPGDFKVRFAMTRNASSAQGGRQRLGDNELWHWAVDYKFDVAEKQSVEIYFVGQSDKAVDNFTNLVRIGGDKVRHGEDYWVGAAYTGVAGPIALKGEIIGQFGKTRKDVCFSTGSSGPASITTKAVDQKLNTSATTAVTAGTPEVNNCTGTAIEDDITRKGALFAYGEATYKIIPAWNVGLGFSFATGDDNPNDDEYNNFVAPLAEYTTSPTRVWTDSQFFHGNRTGRAVGNSTSNRAFNFWGRGTVDVDRLSSTGNNGTDYSPGLFELLFKTNYTFNKEVKGLLNIIPTWAANAPDSSGRYMGTEIDGKIAYKPYKNLVMNAYFGYFISGGFFDIPAGATEFDPGVTKDADNAWMVRTEMIVTF